MSKKRTRNRASEENHSFSSASRIGVTPTPGLVAVALISAVVGGTVGLGKMYASTSMAEIGQKTTQLHALEQACAVRRAILAAYVARSPSAESSFAVITELQRTPPQQEQDAAEAAPTHDARALLRERDDLAFDVLTTQRELDSVREESQNLEDEIQRTSPSDTDLRARAVSAMHDVQETESMVQNDPTKRQRELLRGVILVRDRLTQGLALRSETPWYEDPELTELVLSMDGP